MQAYGYDREGHIDEETPLRLREATLSCNADDLRRIHKFIGDVLAEREAAGRLAGKTWHEHFRDRDDAWTEDESDFIIVFQE